VRRNRTRPQRWGPRRATGGSYRVRGVGASAGLLRRWRPLEQARQRKRRACTGDLLRQSLLPCASRRAYAAVSLSRRCRCPVFGRPPLSGRGLSSSGKRPSPAGLKLEGGPLAKRLCCVASPRRK
jgi:hypothetical protein